MFQRCSSGIAAYFTFMENKERRNKKTKGQDKVISARARIRNNDDFLKVIQRKADSCKIIEKKIKIFKIY